jgi:hypothetical protein
MGGTSLSLSKACLAFALLGTWMTLGTSGQSGDISSGLVLRLHMPRSVQFGDRIDARIEYENKGNNSVTFTRVGNFLWLPDPSWKSPGNYFWLDIRSDTGKTLRYAGKPPNRCGGLATPTVKTGETVSATVRRIDRKFAFPGAGTYTCVAKAKIHAWTGEEKAESDAILESAPVKLDLLPRTEPPSTPDQEARSLFRELAVGTSPHSHHYCEIIEELYDLGTATKHMLSELARSATETAVIRAVTELAKRMDDNSVVAIYIDRLISPLPRGVLASELGNNIMTLEGEKGARKIAGLLEHPDGKVRQRALSSLVHSWDWDIPCLSILIECLDREADSERRQEILEAMGRIMGEQVDSTINPSEVSPYLRVIYTSLQTPPDTRSQSQKEVSEAFTGVYQGEPPPIAELINQLKEYYRPPEEPPTGMRRVPTMDSLWESTPLLRTEPSGRFALLIITHWSSMHDYNTTRVLFEVTEEGPRPLITEQGGAHVDFW